jgi:hypothetical protein
MSPRKVSQASGYSKTICRAAILRIATVLRKNRLRARRKTRRPAVACQWQFFPVDIREFAEEDD